MPLGRKSNDTPVLQNRTVNATTVILLITKSFLFLHWTILPLLGSRILHFLCSRFVQVIMTSHLSCRRLITLPRVIDNFTCIGRLNRALQHGLIRGLVFADARERRG